MTSHFGHMFVRALDGFRMRMTCEIWSRVHMTLDVCLVYVSAYDGFDVLVT